MVVTVMREDDLKVRFSPPQASELEKLEHKSLIDYIYVGKPIDRYVGVYGSAPRIQLNNQIAELEQVKDFCYSAIETRSERDRGRAITSLRADREVTMGIVTDLKTELRKAGRLKVNYSAVKAGY